MKTTNDGRRFEFRTGFGEFRWRGMKTNGDPASNPPNRPRLLKDCRVTEDGEITDRAGWSTFVGPLQSASACVLSIHDFQVSTPKKLWMLLNGCPGISSSAGLSVNNFDPEQDPEFQRAVYYGSATSVILASFNGYMHVGVDATLRRLNLVTMPWGQENLALSGTSQDVPLYTFGGPITCMKEFDGLLFIGVNLGAGASKIYTWDGKSMRDEGILINSPTAFGIYRIQGGGDAIVVGFAAASNQVRIRPAGPSPGTWTTITPGAGTVASHAMRSFKDVLYITDGTANVWSLSGTTLSIVRSPASATAVYGLEATNEYLYYGWETASAAFIGRTADGASWTDSHKAMTTQFSGTSSIRSLAWYRGYLLAGGIRSGGGRIFASNGSDTSGTYTEIVPNALANGTVNDLLVA